MPEFILTNPIKESCDTCEGFSEKFELDGKTVSWEFGNGLTCGHIKLKDESIHPVIFVVVANSLLQTELDTMIRKIKETTN